MHTSVFLYVKVYTKDLKYKKIIYFKICFVPRIIKNKTAIVYFAFTKCFQSNLIVFTDFI